MEGWIKLHRKLTNWQWKDSPKHFSLFIHILLNANHKDNKWRGVDIKKGQFLTGRKKLSEITGLSERKIRTVLKDLETTGEVTIKKFAKYSIITVSNWSSYQASDQQLDQQVTSKRPASDQQVTTNKNDKKEKNKKNENKYIDIEKIIDALSKGYETISQLRERHKPELTKLELDYIRNNGGVKAMGATHEYSIRTQFFNRLKQ